MTSRIVSPQILYDRLKERDRIVLIDVMVDDHFRIVHLPGAINVCVYEIIFLDNIARLIPEKDSEIVIYGLSDQSLEAATAAEKLVGAGYRDVSVLQGGLKGWKASGYELEGEDIGIVDRVEPAMTSENTWYLVDTEQSIIHWFGRNRNTTHHGTLRLYSGEIGIRDGKIEGAFEIDMTSIKDIDLDGDPLQPNLIAHLMSEDFFFVRLFPKAFFTIRSADQIEEVPSSLPNFRVHGIFEMRGLRNDIEFLATASPLQEGFIKIEAHFDIDRTRWGVLYGSSRFFEHLGYHLVYNPISLQILLVARPMAEKHGT
ncbi:MAG: rhodanese-like domain-containing protein [Desulfomonilia bacterium]|jgi:rhodanese-related sulfurtransferase